MIFAALILTGCETAVWAKSIFGTLQHEKQFKDYTVRIYRDEDDNSKTVGLGCLVILKSNKQVYFRPGVNGG
jgi:hypothetical protein